MKTSEEKMVSLLVQLQDRGVATAPKGRDRSDPVMGYLVKSLAPGRPPAVADGGGGKCNPLLKAMCPAPRKARKSNSLSRAMGMK